jgi:hypothetical protein
MALGAEQERTKWESVVSDKEAALADKDARIAKLLAQLGEDKQIANME